VRGTGFGLSSAGSNSTGSSVTLDVSDFCCNEYLDQMVVAIRRNWDQSQGVVGSTTMTFTILRNGTIQSPAGREIKWVRCARQCGDACVAVVAPPSPSAGV
jgi:hypothetical protein